jgi:ADP-ribose pyrophosphatase YjhB (NUDIX family)
MTRIAAAEQLRRLGYRAFYGLPARWRRLIVRLGTAKYIVGAVVLVHDSTAPPPGRLLLLRQPPGVGWSLPAGLIARREEPAEAAARELAEESGIRLDRERMAPAVPSAVVHTRGMWIDMVFLAEVPADRVVLRVDGAEVLEADWHRLDALPPLTVPTARLLAHYGIGPYADYPEARV